MSDNKEQKANTDAEKLKLKVLVGLLAVRNNTYNLFGTKPLAFENSMLKNLDKAGIFVVTSDILSENTALKLEVERLKPNPTGSANIVFEEFWKTIQDEKLEAKEIASLAFDAGHALWHRTDDKKVGEMKLEVEKYREAVYVVMPLNFTPEFLSTKRLQKGYTLRQVEDATGISNSYLSQLENGKITNPSYRTIALLFNFYNHGISITKEQEIAEQALKGN